MERTCRSGEVFSERIRDIISERFFGENMSDTTKKTSPRRVLLPHGGLRAPLG